MFNRINKNKKTFGLAQFGYLLLIVLFLNITTNCWATYSSVYNKELEHLVQTQPRQVLKVATKSLNNVNDDKSKLVALFYIADAYNMLNNYSKIDEFANQGLLLAQQTNNQRFIFEFTYFKIFQLELSGDYHGAFQLANTNAQRAKSLADERLIATALTVRGQMYLNLGNHQFALRDVEEAIEIFKRNNDNKNMSNAFNTLAIIYADFNDFENSIKFYKESLKSTTGKNFDTSTIYYNLGSSYIELNQYDKALEYYRKTIDAASLVNDNYTKTFAENGIADIYLKKDKFDKAIALYLKTLKLFSQDNDIQMLFNVNLSLAQAYIGKKDFDRAKKYLSRSKKYSSTLNIDFSRLNFLKIRERFYESQQLWDKAYTALKKRINLENTIYQSNKEKLVEELKIKYNARFDQEKMKLLQQQNNLQESLILQGKEKNNYLVIIIGLGALIFLVTFIAFLIQKKQRKKLYILSTTDSLTNTYNRRYIISYLKALMSKKPTIQDFAIVMIDLDYFKKVNDTYGHEIGNQVLKHFANTVKQHLAKGEIIGRIGGEEWLVILNNQKDEEIRQVLKSIRKNYQQNKPASISKDCQLNFSSGIIRQAHNYPNYDQILNDVDKALYKAKNSGRGTDCFYTPVL